MAPNNGRDKQGIAGFPPMTDLAHFHEVVGRISDVVGDDHDNLPSALLCIVIKGGGIEQFTLGTPGSAITMMGALELAKIRMLDYLDEAEDDCGCDA